MLPFCLLITLVSSAPLTRAATLDSCKCALVPGPITSDPWTGPPHCAPFSFTVSFVMELEQWGECTAATCTPAPCKAKIEVNVEGYGPCRIRIYENATVIGGGALGLGGTAFAISDFEEACGDFSALLQL
jgi:hypothetical protein